MTLLRGHAGPAATVDILRNLNYLSLAVGRCRQSYNQDPANTKGGHLGPDEVVQWLTFFELEAKYLQYGTS